MSSTDVPTSEDIMSLSTQTKNFIPEAADRRPSFFLSLAPHTSASYPQPRKYTPAPLVEEAPAPAVAAPVAEAVKEESAPVADAAAAAAPLVAEKVTEEPVPTDATAVADAPEAVPTAVVDVKQRRSSSLSSDNSYSGFRFLKLGPVHWGEHLDDHQQDWHEAVIV